MSSRLLVIAFCVTFGISMLDANSSALAGCGDYVILKGNHASFAHEMIQKGHTSDHQSESALIRWNASQYEPSQPPEPCHGPGCDGNRQDLSIPFAIPTTLEASSYPNAVIQPFCIVPSIRSSRLSTESFVELCDVSYSIDRPPA